MMTLEEFQAYCRENLGPPGQLDFEVKLCGTVFLMTSGQIESLILEHRAELAEHAQYIGRRTGLPALHVMIPTHSYSEGQ